MIEYSPLLDSSNVQMEQWTGIAEDIFKRYDEYGGFVVLHGTDTMAYTASALSFMLQGLNKPVVLTGSQIPLEKFEVMQEITLFLPLHDCRKRRQNF